MKVKSKLYRVVLLTVAVVFCSTIVGCNRDSGKNLGIKPTPATATPSGVDENEGQPTSVEPTDEEHPTSSDITEPAVSGTESDALDDDDDELDEPDIIPTVTDDDQDDDRDEPEPPVPTEPEPSDMQKRTELWNNTFLIWVPQFTQGTFAEAIAQTTADKAVFTEVGEADVREYIESVKQKGFVHNVETVDDSNGIIYCAANDDNWQVGIRYNNASLEITSGYTPEQISVQEKTEKLWTTSLLGLLPTLEEGVLTGNGTDTSGGVYCVFEEVSEEYVRSYIETLAGTGFTEDVDNGDSDGYIWYSAGNSDGVWCDLTYYDGCVRLDVASE